MKEYDTRSIRNVAIVGHGGTGKTSLAEAMLFEAGANNRLGRVADRSPVSGPHAHEQARPMTIAAQ